MLNKLIPSKEKRAANSLGPAFGTIEQFQKDFDDLWNHFLSDWRSSGLSRTEGSNQGRGMIDLKEQDDHYVLRAELPGFEPNEFDVKVAGNRLTLSAKHEENREEESGSVQRFGSFYESFTLPAGVSQDDIVAKYHNGVLEIRLPKDQAVQGKRIKVK